MGTSRCLQRGRNLIVCLAFCATALSVPLSACAQEVISSVEPGQKTKLNIEVRPNTATVQRLFLTRPTVDEFTKVKLILKDENGVEREIAEGKYDRSKLKESRLTFKMNKDVSDKKEGGDKKEGAGKKEDKIVVTDPRARFQLKVDENKPITLVKQILEPRGYVTPVQAGYDAGKSKVYFTLKIEKDKSRGGPRECPVQLILGPEFEEPKKGVLKNVITDLDQDVELYAENVSLRKGFDRGTVSLKVDDYERAFNYVTNLKEVFEKLGKEEISASVRAPLYSVPMDKLPLRLEMNGPLHENYELVIGLDRTGSKRQFQTLKTHVGLRRQQLELSFTDEGDLLWKTNVQDWQEEFNVTGVLNPVWFKVSVKGTKGGEPTGDAPIDLFPGTRPSEDEKIDGKALYTRVFLDPTPAENVRFVGLPAKALQGGELTVWATADERDPDRQAPIDKVTFYLGKAPPDGKIAPDAVAIVAQNDPKDKKMYFARVDLPEKKETLELFVQFTTRNGLSVLSKTEVVRLQPPLVASKSNKIKGVVVHGDTPQPEMKVGLFEAKTLKLKKTVSTNKKGVFVFENVEPGEYIISAGTTYPRIAGQTDVEVPQPNEELVKVNLLAK